MAQRVKREAVASLTETLILSEPEELDARVKAVRVGRAYPRAALARFPSARGYARPTDFRKVQG